MKNSTVAAAVLALALLPSVAHADDAKAVNDFLLSPSADALSTVEARYHRHHGHGSRHGYHHRHRSRHGYRHRRHARLAHGDVPSHSNASYAGAASGIFEMVTRSAISHGLPVALAHGIVRAESGYRCTAYNHGAQGIMQIKDASARSVGVSGGLRSCARGLEAGMRYLHLAYVAAHGKASLAATLYNRGLGARPVTSSYSRSVVRLSRL